MIADVERDRGEALAATLGADAVFRSTDVSDPDQVGALVAGAVETFGGLDVMVNNAGVSSRMHRSFLDDDLADFPALIGLFGASILVGGLTACGHHRYGDWSSMSEADATKMRERMIDRLRRSTRKDPNRASYHDTALAPVETEDTETLALFTHNEGARSAVQHARKIKELTKAAAG